MSYMVGVLIGIVLGIILDTLVCTALARIDDTSPNDADEWYDKW